MKRCTCFFKCDAKVLLFFETSKRLGLFFAKIFISFLNPFIFITFAYAIR